MPHLSVHLGQRPRRRPTFRASGLDVEGRFDAGSEMAVDALVVATAIRLGGGLILTHDPADLEQLAVDYPNVRVAPV